MPIELLIKLNNQNGIELAFLNDKKVLNKIISFILKNVQHSLKIIDLKKVMCLIQSLSISLYFHLHTCNFKHSLLFHQRMLNFLFYYTQTLLNLR